MAREPVSVPITLREAQHPPTACPSMRLVADWLRDFVARPHARLGRVGSVCPFVPAAIGEDTLWLCTVSGAQLCAEQVVDAFSTLAVTNPKLRVLLSLSFIFPGMSGPSAGVLINDLHGSMLVELLEQGLMPGGFYPGNATPGIHGQDFFPMQSPVPLIAVRHLVTSDLALLRQLPNEAIRERTTSAYERFRSRGLLPSLVL